MWIGNLVGFHCFGNIICRLTASYLCASCRLTHLSLMAVLFLPVQTAQAVALHCSKNTALYDNVLEHVLCGKHFTTQNIAVTWDICTVKLGDALVRLFLLPIFTFSIHVCQKHNVTTLLSQLKTIKFFHNGLGSWMLPKTFKLLTSGTEPTGLKCGNF